MSTGEGEAEYHSKDFEWEELKHEVESNPSLRYHLLPFSLENPSSSPSLVSAQEDSRAWQNFHTRHSSGKFFKERRYLLKEFPELVSSNNSKVLEVGCGSGSTAVSLLRGNTNAVVYACDSSTEALERAREWLACTPCQQIVPQKQNGCLPDLIEVERKYTVDPHLSLRGQCCIGGVDFVTMIFTLSAMPLQRMPTAVRECFSVLKPGGLLFFRDYGLYDMTMLRFGPEQRTGFREYMRSDGTRSYFFCLDTVKDLFSAAGFIQVELEYCCIKAVNRRNGKSMRRVWVHGKFKRPG